MFLPKPKRAAITAFYAYCREIDDVVDEVSDPSIAQVKLGWWRTEVARLFDGQPTHPAMQAMQPHLSAYGITAAHLNAVIDGCEMDLTQTRYLDYANLQAYCHLVAGVVGEVAARIFGQTVPETTAYAHAMGQAFQLTNIIRDVGEDAMRGRIYLPINEMQQFDVKAHEIIKREMSPRFQALMAFQVQRAHDLYDQALAQLPVADYRSQKPGLMMANIYRSLLREIGARWLSGARPSYQPHPPSESCGWLGKRRPLAGSHEQAAWAAGHRWWGLGGMCRSHQGQRRRVGCHPL